MQTFLVCNVVAIVNLLNYKTGGTLTLNQETNNGMRDSGNSVLNTNATSNVSDLSLPP